jgi:hypothetical protein
LPAPHLFGDAVAELIDRFCDQTAQLVPVGLLGMPLVLLSRRSSPITNPRRFSAQFRVIEQFLDVAHPIGPLTEAFPGDRPTVGGSSKLSLASR